VHSVILSD